MDATSFIPTRGSNYRNTAVQYQEVSFINPSKRKTNENSISTFKPKNSDFVSNNRERETFDIKRAKYEIKKFAKSNVPASEREKSLQELAIELGARPLRKKCINYKEILAQKQKEKLEQLQVVEDVRLGKAPVAALKGQRNNKPQTKEKDLFLSAYGKATQGKSTGRNKSGRRRK